MTVAKNTIVDLQMQMIKRFTPGAMRRGWNLFQSAKVNKLNVQKDRIQAEVRGKELYVVKLDLIHFDRSSCACSVRSYCPHMAAVFFQVYSHYEKRTELFLMQHQQMRLQMKQERSKKANSPKKKDSQSIWEQDWQDIHEQTPLAMWQLDLEKKFTGYFSNTLHHVESFHAEADKYIVRVSGHWESPVREMYQAFAQLFMLVLAENRFLSLMDGYKPEQVRNGFAQLFQLCIQGFQKRIKRVPIRQLREMRNHLLEESVDFLHKHVFRSKPTPVGWLDVYRLFCWRLAEETSPLLNEEQKWLEEELSADERKDDIRRVHLQLALFHLRIITGDEADDTLPQLLDLLLSNGELTQCFTYLKHWEETGDWLTMKAWLDGMLDAVRLSKNKSFIRQYLEYWEQTEQHIDCGEARHLVLRKLLPYSFADYAEFLLQRKQYNSWIQLQMTADSSPLELSRSWIQEIEHHDMTLLLPIYHQSIDRYIGERKRESYRSAVQLLKVLRTYYDKLQESQRFEQYMKLLLEKYHMLRAFQEEIRRGNLIS